MAGMGPPPKENKRRRNADTFGAAPKTIAADGRTRGPGLKGDWSAETRAWYTTWRKSPQASILTPTDWMRLQMLASLVEAYFADPTVQLMAEIRQNEALLGATHLDRLRGRMTVEDKAKPSRLASVTPADAYRKRLGA